MADRSGTVAETEAATEPGAALTPMGQFLGRPDLPLSRAVTTIGSRDTCRLQLDSRSISRVHALIVCTPQGAYVSDLCSRTGVLVNGRSVRDTNLVGGDRVQFGRFTFRFRAQGDPGGTGGMGVNPSAPPLALQHDDALIAVPGRALLIGRRENADLPLVDDEAVSTAHAVLFQMDGRWFVRDLASRTGTRVNNATIDIQQRVKIGDTIQIGATSFTLTPAPPAAEPAENDDHAALPLETDPHPLADLEPLDFSSIDSIEAGGTPDDALPAEPTASAIPLEAGPGDAAELHDAPAADESVLDEVDLGKVDVETPAAASTDLAPLPLEEEPQATTPPEASAEPIPATDVGEVGDADGLDWEIDETFTAPTAESEPTTAPEPIEESTEDFAPEETVSADAFAAEPPAAAVEAPPIDFLEAADGSPEPVAEPAAEASEAPADVVEPAVEELPEPVAADETAPTFDLAEGPTDGVEAEPLQPASASESAAVTESPAPVALVAESPAESLAEPPAEPSASPTDEMPPSEQPPSKAKRKRAARKPAAPKRGRPGRAVDALGDLAEGVGIAAAGAAGAGVAGSAAAALPGSIAAVAAGAAPGLIEPAAASALAFEAAVADEPTSPPVEEPIPTRPSATAPPLELSELAEGEEFVAVPEADVAPPARTADAMTASEGAEEVVAEGFEFEPVAETAEPFAPTADAEVSNEAPLLDDETDPLEPLEEDWLIDQPPVELPLTEANTATVTREPEQPQSIAAALPEGDFLLDADAASTTATSAGPGIFGFSFEGGAFLGGAATEPPPDTVVPPASAAPPAPAGAEAQPPEALLAEPETAAEAALPAATSIAPELEPTTEVLSLDDFPDVPSADIGSAPVEPPSAPVPAAVVSPPAAPTPIPTLSDEVTVPPLATPVRTPPRQRRALTTAFDGLSGGAKITGFVGGVSVNGRAPAARGGPSVDVFSQLAPAIGVDALVNGLEAFTTAAAATAAAVAAPVVSRRLTPAVVPAVPPTMPRTEAPAAGEFPTAEPATMPGDSAIASAFAAPVDAPFNTTAQPAPVDAAPRVGKATKKKRRWPLWGLLALMFLSLGAVWAGVYGLVPQASRVNGTLSFANLSEQDVATQRAFETDQVARLHSNEVRTIARSILLAGGAPTGFTEDMMALGRALDRDGSATFHGNTLSVVVQANDPVEGRSQMDAMLSALAQRDKDLGDTQQRAAQDSSDTNAAVATARDKLDSLKAELLTMRARGEDRPDPEEVASLQSASDRAQRLLTLAGSARLNAEAELDLVRQPLPKPAAVGAGGQGADAGGVALPDSPRDAQLTRLRWELQDLARQVNDLKSTRPDAAPGPSASASSDGTTPAADPNDALLVYLDTQVQALTAALSDQATSIPGPAGEAVRLRQMEALSVRVNGLQQAEKTSQANAQLAVDKLRNVQGRLDSARQATVEIDQLIADIRAAETTLRDKSDAAAAAQQKASFAVSVAGDPSESVQPLEDRRPVYAGVLSGLLLCVFSALAINALRASPEPKMVDAISGEEVEHQAVPAGGFPTTGFPEGGFPMGGFPAEPVEETVELEYSQLG